MTAQNTMADFSAIVRYGGPDKVVHFTDYLLSKTGEKDGLNFKSGFSVLNEKIGGVQTGEVVIISGYTKNGKTLFAESWVRSMAKNDSKAKAAIFSFEVQTERLLIKY